VEVCLGAGGLDLISVRDDGEGMAAEDALVAFARHATSKLARAEDLPAVTTLGFRGEALPSIAAVARVRLVTRRAADAGGVAVEADAAGARPAGAAGAPPGTSVEVRELFAETPARRKFLRSAPTEVGHVVDVLTRLAVASPAVGFRLEHDRREVLAFPPVAEARQRLVQVLGRARAAGLVPVEAAAGGYTLAGFLAPPRETLATARLVWTYVAVGGAGAPLDARAARVCVAALHRPDLRWLSPLPGRRTRGADRPACGPRAGRVRAPARRVPRGRRGARPAARAGDDRAPGGRVGGAGRARRRARGGRPRGRALRRGHGPAAHGAAAARRARRGGAGLGASEQRSPRSGRAADGPPVELTTCASSASSARRRAGRARLRSTSPSAWAVRSSPPTRGRSIAISTSARRSRRRRSGPTSRT